MNEHTMKSTASIGRALRRPSGAGSCRRFAAAGVAAGTLLLAGCGAVGPQKVEIDMPTSGRTAAMQSAPLPQANGAIFQVLSLIHI